MLFPNLIGREISIGDCIYIAISSYNDYYDDVLVFFSYIIITINDHTACKPCLKEEDLFVL